MTNNAKKFLEFASKNEVLKKELDDAGDTEVMLKLAAAHGFTLTAEDFGSSEMEEMNEDELKAIAGGSFMMCTPAGIANYPNLVCYCADGSGQGHDPDPGASGSCTCGKAGLGWN